MTPTPANQQARARIDARLCTGCGACASVCPAEAITIVDGKAAVDQNICRGCGICVETCRKQAIELV